MVVLHDSPSDNRRVCHGRRAAKKTRKRRNRMIYRCILALIICAPSTPSTISSIVIVVATAIDNNNDNDNNDNDTGYDPLLPFQRSPTMNRFASTQRDRRLIHPKLLQPPTDADDDANEKRQHHRFVVCADTQLGMRTNNADWSSELEYSRRAVRCINQLDPAPSFCCICGDLVHMDRSYYANDDTYTQQQCDDIQKTQQQDLKETWTELNDDIVLVCLCGNHDVGNTPTKDSITRFSNAFGDDYLAFWANGTYNIALNSTLIANHSQAEDLYQDQLKWLQERLAYATEKNARHIFVFSHHPWFLFHEDEDETKDLTGHSRIPAPGSKTEFWDIPDSYFVMPKRHRMVYMDLFRKHKVKAAFCGHFHQNWVAKTSFGMDMIVTGSLSVLLKSTSSSEDAAEPNVQGIRIVDVGGSHGTNGSDGDGDGNGDVNAGVRCEGTFEHKFVPVA